MFEKCPVCGQENRRTRYSDEKGICEDYYTCYNCTYIERMCYSEYTRAVCADYPKQYKSKVRELGIDVLSMETYSYLI